MPGMERLGGSFSPRASKSQMGMSPQKRFNMPSVGGGLMPMKGSGGGTGNLNPGGAAMPRGPGSGGGLSLPRPPSTQQPGMGGGGMNGGGFQGLMPTVGTPMKGQPLGGGLKSMKGGVR